MGRSLPVTDQQRTSVPQRNRRRPYRSRNFRRGEVVEKVDQHDEIEGSVWPFAGDFPTTDNYIVEMTGASSCDLHGGGRGVAGLN